MKKREIFFCYRQAFRFWIELPFVYALSFLCCAMIFADWFEKPFADMPVIAWILTTFFAPLGVLMWFNIRGKEEYVRGKLMRQAARFLKGDIRDGHDAYYIFVFRYKQHGRNDWARQLYWDDQGHKLWGEALKEAWNEKYGMPWPYRSTETTSN